MVRRKLYWYKITYLDRAGTELPFCRSRRFVVAPDHFEACGMGWDGIVCDGTAPPGAEDFHCEEIPDDHMVDEAMEVLGRCCGMVPA